MIKKKYCKVHDLPCKGNFTLKYTNTIKDTFPIWKVTGKTFVSSLKHTDTVREDVKKIMFKLKQSISRNITSSIFNDNFIFDYDFIKNIEPTFKNKTITFDLFLKQNKDSDVKESLLKLLEDPLDNLTEKFHDTNLYITNARQ